MFSIFGIAFGAILFGILVAVFITRQPTPQPIMYAPPEDDFEKDPKDHPPLTLEDLFKLGEKICAKNGLKIKDKIPVEEGEVYWIAESENELFFGNYVIGFHQATAENPFVSMAPILEFKDFIKSATGAKGLYITTGYFTKDVYQPLEGPKVNLFNRRKVIEELKGLK